VSEAKVQRPKNFVEILSSKIVRGRVGKLLEISEGQKFKSDLEFSMSMNKPEVLHLRYHHIDFIRYLGTINAMGQQVGFQMREDYFGENQGQLQELSDHLVEWGNTPIVWVDGADDICSLCRFVDADKKRCGSYTKSDRDYSLSPEELRKRADLEAKRAYDTKKVRKLRDILRLERRAVVREF